MRGTIKWFHRGKGYGFIFDTEGKDYFLHYSSIIMDGFKHLDEDDIVEFDIGKGTNDRLQAINVKPILTRKMMSDALKKEGLRIKDIDDDVEGPGYIVVDENNFIQSDEHGMSFVELAAYAGFDVEGLGL